MTSSLTGCLTHPNPPIITYLHTKVCSGLSHISHLWRSNGHGIILQNLHRRYKHCSVMQRLCIIPSKDHKFGITVEGCQSFSCIWRHKSQCILEPWMGELTNARSSKKTRGKRLSDEQKGQRTKRRSAMDEPSLNISLDSSLEFRMNNIYDESDDDDDDAPGSNSIFDIAASLFLNIFIGNVSLVQYLMARDLAPEVLNYTYFWNYFLPCLLLKPRATHLCIA